MNFLWGCDLLEISPMTWMTMLMSEAWESTLVMRTLQSWNSSSFILSLMAWEVSMNCHVRHAISL